MAITVNTLKKMKMNKDNITMLTCYDYLTAKIIDQAGVDVVLIGDSVGTTYLGYPSTVHVTIEDMLHHTKCVSKAVKNAFIVSDMPFLSYHLTISQSVENAGIFIREGYANAVKLEGGEHIVPHIKAIINAGIPVVGHLGLTPQSVNVFGGYIVQGKTKQQAEKLKQDAVALCEAGICMLVLECVPYQLAKEITELLSIPVIGIGAGNACDGQVLVITDLLGMDDTFSPIFVKKYADLNSIIKSAVGEYIADIKNSRFPSDENTFFDHDKGEKK